MTEVYSNQPFKRSQYTQILVDKLSELKEGNLITYKDLSEAINADVQFRNRHYLMTAIDIVMREFDIVLVCTAGVGYTRIPNNEISRHSTNEHQRRMQRDTVQFRKKIECVDVQKLTSEERLDHTLAATYVTMREKLTTKKTERTLKNAIVRKMDGWLPDKDAFMAVFGDKG